MEEKSIILKENITINGTANAKKEDYRREPTFILFLLRMKSHDQDGYFYFTKWYFKL